MIRLAVIATLTAFLASTASAAFSFWQVRPIVAANVPYGLSGEETADVYQLPGDNTKKRPAVLLIHGGGWRSGDKAGYSGYAKKLAAKGIASVSINYRLFREDAGVNHWPAQIQDVQLAVRWLRANASTYGIDPNRICAWGDSAGGHLALLLGSMNTVKPGDRSHLYADQSPSVKCVIDMFGPTHLASPSLNNLRSYLTVLLGGKSPEQAPKIWEEASPAAIANKASAPTLIVHGLTDDVVSFEQAKDMKAALDKNGVANEFVPFMGGHWFKDAASDRVRASAEKMMVDYAVKMLNP